MIKEEWKRLSKKPILIMVLLVIMLIPSIYAGCFLASMWDPYGELDKLPVAVVNNDKPVTYNDNLLQVGNDLVDKLSEDGSLNFSFVEEDKAKKGLEDGTYYMVITIPENFSKNAATVMDPDPVKMGLTYETNPATNYVATKLSESAMNRMEASLNETVSETYISALFDQLKGMGGSLEEASDGASAIYDGETEVADGAAQLENGASKLQKGTEELSAGTSSLSTGMTALAKGSNTLKNGTSALKEGNQSVADGANQVAGASGQVANGAESLKNGLSDLDNGATALNTGLSQLESQIPTLTNGISDLANGSAQVSAGLQTLANNNTALTTGASNLADGLGALSSATGNIGTLTAGSAQVASALNTLASSMGSVSTLGNATEETVSAEAYNQVVAAYNQLASGYNNISGQISSLASTYSQLNGGIQNLNGLPSSVSALSEGANTLSQSVAQYTGGVATLSSGAAQVSNGLQQLNGNTASLSGAIAQLSNGASQISAGTKSALQGAEQLSTGTKLLSKGANTLADGARVAAEGAAKLDEGAASLQDGIATAKAGSVKLDNGANSLRAGTAQLHDGTIDMVNGLPALLAGTNVLKNALSDGADEIDATPTEKSNISMMASPVELTETQITSVKDNGHAMAAYMLSVGLWVACLAFCLMYPLASHGKLTNGFSWWASKATILYPLAIIQSFIVIFVLKAMLGFEPADLSATIGMACLASVAFMSMMYFFNLLLGKVGSFLMLIFMVLQLAGSAGTYPIEISGPFAAALHDYMPFTYTVAAFRSTIGGGASYTSSIVVLSAIAIVFTALTILVFLRRAKKEGDGTITIYEWLETKGLA